MFDDKSYSLKMDKTIEVFAKEISSLRTGRANAAMLDIIKVDVYDPYIKEHNNFISNPFLIDKKYDAILVAVAHHEFLKYSISDFEQISKGKLVFLDIKGIYNESKWKL